VAVIAVRVPAAIAVRRLVIVVRGPAVIAVRRVVIVARVPAAIAVRVPAVIAVRVPMIAGRVPTAIAEEIVPPIAVAIAATVPAWEYPASSTTRSRSLPRSRSPGAERAVWGHTATAACALALVSLAASGLGCGGKKQPPAATDAAVIAEPSPPVDGGSAPTAPDAGAAAAVVRPERAVFSLGDNLLTAHRQVDGELVIDAGSVGFARYTRFDLPSARWRLRRDAQGQRVAVAERGGSIEVPLTAPQAAAATGLALRIVAERPRKLTVRVGLRTVGRLDVTAGRAWYAVPTPTDAWREGENPIVLDGAVALEAVRVTADAARAAADPEPLTHASWDDTARTLTLDRGAGYAWYVHLPADAHLIAQVPAPCRVEVEARTDDGTRVGGLLGGGRDRVELSGVGDRAVRLSITAQECDRAVIADPIITVPGVPAVVPPPGPPARYVVLWIMDALRADRVRTFSPGARAEVPHFDALAQTSAVFRQYYVHGNESQTSHASLWTGTFPAVHNVRQAGVGGTWRIPRQLSVLGELVAAAGLQPIAVTGNGFVTDVGGYGRGFVEFRNMMREKGVINGYLPGRLVVNAALARLEVRKSDPTLLFLGTVDNHGPWVARKPWIDRYSDPSYRGPFVVGGTAAGLGIIPGQMGCTIIPPPADIERLRAIYDSAISYQDERLGDLVAALQRMGIYEQTMIVVTADHGEELFEDTRCGHGGSLRETLVRVPLLIHYPPRIAPGIVDEGVDQVDVLPTILDAIGAEAPPQLQGQSLAPLAAGVGRGWPRPSYASQFEYAHTMRIGRWKLKVGKRGVATTLDVVGDPDERIDQSAQRPAVRRLLTDALGLFLATRVRWSKRDLGVVTNLAPGAAAKLEQTP